MNKARITYRFDSRSPRGREVFPKEPQPGIIPLNPEEFEVVKEEGPAAGTDTAAEGGKEERKREFAGPLLNQYTTDFGTWNSPFDAETERLERLIRGTETGGRAPAGGSQRREDWPGPDAGQPDEALRGTEGALRSAEETGGNPDPHSPGYRPEYGGAEDRGGRQGSEDRPVRQEFPRFEGPFVVDERLTTRMLRPSRPPWFKIAAAVAGAVATGVCFGFFVLTMFADQPGTQNAASPPPSAATVQKPPENAAKTPVGEAAAQTPEATAAAQPATGTVTLNVPAQSFSILQAGVFSTQQGADALQSELAKKGLAAATMPGDKFTVYAGVALSRGDALALSTRLQQGNVEVYIKDFTLPAAAQVKWNGSKTEALSNYLTQGTALFKQMNQVTVRHLGEAQPGALADAELAAIASAHQTWTGLAPSVQEGAPDDARAALADMGKAMNTALESLGKYKKNTSAAYLWQTQSSLMQYLTAEKQLLSVIAAP
jgi:stage II sporulation protein B